MTFHLLFQSNRIDIRRGDPTKISSLCLIRPQSIMVLLDHEMTRPRKLLYQPSYPSTPPPFSGSRSLAPLQELTSHSKECALYDTESRYVCFSLCLPLGRESDRPDHNRDIMKWGIEQVASPQTLKRLRPIACFLELVGQGVTVVCCYSVGRAERERRHVARSLTSFFPSFRRCGSLYLFAPWSRLSPSLALSLACA